MRCRTCRRQLETPRPGAAGERQELQEHLRACSACRQYQRELERLEHLLGPAPSTEPRRDLWPAVAARLTAQRQRSTTSAWRRRPALALAAATLGLLVALGVWVSVPPAPPDAQMEAWLTESPQYADPWAGEVAETLAWTLSQGS